MTVGLLNRFGPDRDKSRRSEKDLEAEVDTKAKTFGKPLRWCHKAPCYRPLSSHNLNMKLGGGLHFVAPVGGSYRWSGQSQQEYFSTNPDGQQLPPAETDDNESGWRRNRTRPAEMTESRKYEWRTSTFYFTTSLSVRESSGYRLPPAGSRQPFLSDTVIGSARFCFFVFFKFYCKQLNVQTS